MSLPNKVTTIRQSPRAEKGLIGGLIVFNDMIPVIKALLSPEQFYTPHFALMYKAILALTARGLRADEITISEQLQTYDREKTIRGLVDFAELRYAGGESPADVESHACVIAELAESRAWADAAHNVLHTVDNAAYDPSEVRAKCADHFAKAAQTRGRIRVVDSSELGEAFLQKIVTRAESPAGITGVTTGLRDLDALLGGLQKKTEVIVAGRPGMGKTAMLMKIARSIAASQAVQRRVMFLSLEMPVSEIYQRMVCSQALVPTERIKGNILTQEHMRSLSEAVMDIAQLPIRWCDEATNLHDICAEATREHAKDPLGALVIDLLQKISVPNERVRERQIAIASETLKSLAKRLDIPVVIACHVNRGKEDAPDKRPELSDLRESGAIEGDADIVIFIYRDEYYNRGHDNPERGIAELIVAKHRDGPTDTIPVAYAKESTQFHDLADHEISAWRERKLARESGGTGRRRRPAAAPVQSPRFSVDPDDLPPEN